MKLRPLTSLIVALLGPVTACGSTPEVRPSPDAAGATPGPEPVDPFVACVAPAIVTVHREDGAPETAVLDALEAASPDAALAFRATADRCGAWRAGDGLPAHIAAALAWGACERETCPDDWPRRLATAMRKAPESAVPPGQEARCVEATPAAGWADWARDRLLGDPALPLEAWVDRAGILGTAQLASADVLVLERLERSDDASRLALSRLALTRLKGTSERLRYAAAVILVTGGDGEEGRRWLNQLATAGRTAWRAFARAELDRLDRPRGGVR